MPTKKIKDRVTVIMPTALKAKLKKKADKNGQTMSYVIIDAIKKVIK